MKKFLLLAIAVVSALSAAATLNGNGFYRVQNAATKRFAYILDDRGSYDVANTTADVGAIVLYKDLMRSKSDPATVLYFENSSGSFYDIASQGTSIYTILETYVKVYKAVEYEGDLTYYIYASKSGMARYLGDTRSDMNKEEGISSVDAQNERRYWYVNPIDPASDEYFGIAPTVTAGGNYYCPLYAGFPFSAYSSGIKFYIVTDIDPIGVAVINEVTGTVPAGTPVIVECANPLPSDNRLNIGAISDYGTTDGNLLGGVYFENQTKAHNNLTAFDRNSMRVLGEVDGKLAFVRGDCDFIPRNQAYLQISDPALQGIDDLLVMTPSELEAYKAWLSENSVEVMPQDALADVYTIDGRQIKSNFPKTEVSSLPKGLYILRSGKNSEKLLLK